MSTQDPHSAFGHKSKDVNVNVDVDGDVDGDGDATSEDVDALMSSRSVSNSQITGIESSSSGICPLCSSVLERHYSNSDSSIPAAKTRRASSQFDCAKQDSYEEARNEEARKTQKVCQSTVITLLGQEGMNHIQNGEYLNFYVRFSELRKDSSQLCQSKAS